ncbi:hypothetical protein MVEN_01415200 [Mycena venus]|uniref:Uncharacterized protein n=1 Tax=Mycena venus TaxID=2733690 RepID=A0A8H6XYK9_9AGAR|nr:hypothetical protein MVEN_01415200 [Mycena venus]
MQIPNAAIATIFAVLASTGVTAAPTSYDLELRDDNDRIPAAQALANAIGGRPINKCEDTCVALRNSINNLNSLNVLCTNSTLSAINVCYNCEAQANAVPISSLQSAADQFISTCKANNNSTQYNNVTIVATSNSNTEKKPSSAYRSAILSTGGVAVVGAVLGGLLAI